MRGAIRNHKAKWLCFLFCAALAVCLSMGESMAEEGVELRFRSVTVQLDAESMVGLEIQLTNHTAAPADPARVMARILVKGEEQPGYMDDMPHVKVWPGHSFCFFTRWYGEPGITDPKVEVYYADGETAAFDYEYTESEGIIRRKNGQFYDVILPLRNASSEAIKGKPVSVAFFDRSDELLYVENLNTGSIPIPAGGQIFRCWTPYPGGMSPSLELLTSKTDVAYVKVYTIREATESEEWFCGDYVYSPRENGSAGILVYAGTETELNLPAKLDGWTVSVIHEGAFTDCDTITSAVIPEGYEIMEKDAFLRCANLQSVSIPTSMVRMEASQFGGCARLTRIQVAEGNPEYYVTEDVLFSRRERGLLKYPRGKSDVTFTVPKGIRKVAYGAFEGNDRLEKVILPETLSEIGEAAFYQCIHLSGLNLPESLMQIGDYAFYETALTSVVWPAAVKSMGAWMFHKCGSLGEVTLPSGLQFIGDSAFRETAIHEIRLPDTLTEIDHMAFAFCPNLKELTIPDSVQKIGGAIFAGCDALTEVRVSAENPVFQMKGGILYDLPGHRVIGSVPGITGGKVTLPDGIQVIDFLAFGGHDRILSLEMPDTVTRIGDFAFADCTSLRKIHLSARLTELGTQTFQNCSALKTVDLPETLGEIPMGAFANCTALESITISENVKNIGPQAFRECDSLKTVRLPDHMTGVEYEAFALCDALEEVYFPTGVTRIGEKIFYHSPLVTAVVMENSPAMAYCDQNRLPYRIEGSDQIENEMYRWDPAQDEAAQDYRRQFIQFDVPSEEKGT